MNLTKKTIITLGLLAALGVSHAQTQPVSTTNGLLGQRFADVSFGVQDVNLIGNNAYAVSGAFNLPLLPSLLDLGGSYSYQWLRSGGTRLTANTLAGTATFYAPLGNVKPFATGILGYQWSRAGAFGSEDRGVWGVAVGAEIPVGALTLTPKVIYSDDFESSANGSQDYTYALEGNYWVTPDAAVYATVGYTEVRHTPIEAWTYTAGIRFKF